MARALKPGQTISIKGKRFKITRSTRKGKHWKACPAASKGPCVHFGAKGAKVMPGTPKGDSFCARTLPLSRKQRSKAPTPNDFARRDWRCSGAKSR